MVKWNSSMEGDEATPIMHPVRMELAPHARLGRRMAASTAIFVLLVFHVSMIVIGTLNMDADCGELLWLYLVIYGGVGLLFVYLLFREWLYYARLSSLPNLMNLVLLIVFYACLTTSGGFLAYYTYETRDTCLTTAPLLYRWCEAAVLFFVILSALFLLVPVLRGTARLFCAPCALCLISCVETVGVDVEVGDIAAIGDEGASFAGGVGGGGGGGPGMGGGAGLAGSGKPSQAQREQAAAAAITLTLCGPCLLACSPVLFCLRPIGKCFKAACMPFALAYEGALTSCGCMTIEAGGYTCHNPFAGCSLFVGAKGFAQMALAPGCIVPGRSLIALFVNTAALLWFFLYLAFILYDSWEITCTTYDPGVPFADAPFTWLVAGAPSPIHWLLLLFAVGGTVLVVVTFVYDMFAGPSPPPRSYYEATLWRGRRQVKVVFVVLLLAAFLGWGILLTYYTFTDDGCATNGSERPLQSLYNVAYLLVLLFIVLFGLILTLACCVVLDCFVSGRVRLVMLLSQPEPPLPPPPEQYKPTDGAESFVPGVPPRDQQATQYGSSGGGGALFGAVEESQSRLCTSGEVQASSWGAPGAKMPKPR